MSDDVTGGAGSGVPAVVSLHLYGVAGLDVLRAVARMGLDRRPVRALPGARFVKLLGTGSGRTFTVRDADPHHWGVLACWSDDDGPARYEQSRSHGAWSAMAHEQARILLRPLGSRGTWAGRLPFGDPRPQRWDGPVAALTRARIRPTRWRTFWASVPPVSDDLARVEGLELALGIGEAPVGLQGTFSLWSSGAAVSQFTHRREAHQVVVRRTRELDWYAEELFARFAVLDARGRYDGRDVGVGGRTP
ncbi:MAG: monooxygenase [Frankiales bacterium]|nr:monooxygenase [Frankiales bacterium]